MRAVIRVVKDLLLLIVAAVVGSIVGSLMLMLAVTSIYQSPLVTLLVALLFTPFHLSDYKRFFEEREWSLIALRFVLLTAITSFLVGMFRAALGDMSLDWFLPVLLMFTAPVLFILIAAYLFFAFFLPDNSAFVGLNRWWNGLVRGGKAYGVWWDY